MKPALEPIERVSESLFGLIMVLTFTGSLSVAEAGRGEVRDMLVGALGCNLAWGMIDAVFYLMGVLAERGRGLRALRAVRSARPGDEARAALAGALPGPVADALDPDDYEGLRARLRRLPEPPARPRLAWPDVRAAVAVFAWVFLVTFPVTLPFLFMQDLTRAMRASNAIAVALLFVAGLAFGRITGYRPWRSGLAMVVLGSILVSITIALGG